MKKYVTTLIVFALTGASTQFLRADEFEVRGNIELQSRYFVDTANYSSQHDQYASLAVLPEFFWSWNEGNDSFEFVPSFRVDQHDEERTHSDIRDLSWVHVGDDWESRIGIRRVFWGVTEFQHLVDVINQSDSVEDVDNEDKLGQPMINLSFVKDWGILDLYLLPYFRERTFAGIEGRPGVPFINVEQANYESSDAQQHIDWAARWTHSMNDFEIAVSWFEGTSRDPLLFDPRIPESLTGIPFYQQVSQLGFELQTNIDASLWKLELIHNENGLQSYWAMQGGLEYSLYGFMDSNADLGLLIEYGWDERGEDASSNFQNDLFFGSRLALNDVNSSELLAGMSYDFDFQSSSFMLEASRRYGNSIKLSLDIRLFSSDEPEDPVYLLRNDDHVQLTVQYYY